MEEYLDRIYSHDRRTHYYVVGLTQNGTLLMHRVERANCGTLTYSAPTEMIPAYGGLIDVSGKKHVSAINYQMSRGDGRDLKSWGQAFRRWAEYSVDGTYFDRKQIARLVEQASRLSNA